MRNKFWIIWNITGILFCLGFLFLGVVGLLEFIKNINNSEAQITLAVGFAIPLSFGVMHISNLIEYLKGGYKQNGKSRKIE